MDNMKTGSLIRELRKEKGLTQLQLADQLHITDRAVSKWERGLCAPDIALLEPLSKILDVSILELIEGRRSEPSQRIPEIQDTAIAVIDYSSNEINQKVQQNSNRLLLTLCLVLLIIIGICGYFLWQSGTLFVIDRENSPDGLYTITVYNKKLVSNGFTTEDSTSLIVEKKDEDLSYRVNYGNGIYQGIWWSPDSQKYVLSIKGSEGTRLILNSLELNNSANLNAYLAFGVETTELSKYGYRWEGVFPDIHYEFLQWALDSQYMLIYYSFEDKSDALHEGYFWYNCDTGDINAILEMDLTESEES